MQRGFGLLKQGLAYGAKQRHQARLDNMKMLGLGSHIPKDMERGPKVPQ